MELVESLRLVGRVELVWSARGAEHTSHWFHKVESSNDYVVYVADHQATSWTKLCVRQADALLLLAQCGQRPRGPGPRLPKAAINARRDSAPS